MNIDQLNAELNRLIDRRDRVRLDEQELTESISKLRLDIYALAAKQRQRTKSENSAAVAAKSKAAAERRAEVYEMRSSGLTFTEIASRLGVSYGRARDLFVIEDDRRRYYLERAAKTLPPPEA